ncbi:MAG: carboxypeptidase-like regulatory domain-containing protein [Gemmataceae bacterium]
MLHRSAAPVRGAAFLFVAAFAVVGCGRPVGSVSGTVTYDGKALKGGGVAFVSTDGGESFAASITPEGTYKVPNIRGGSYKVTVDNTSLKSPDRGAGGKVTPTVVVPPGAKFTPPPGANIPEGYTPSNPNAMKDLASGKNYVELPKKYLSADSTDLTFTFKGGDVTFPIDLK